MKTANIVVESYWALLSGLSNESKRLIVKRLKASIKATSKPTSAGFEKAFGAWQGEESAEEIIEAIHQARTASPNREEF